MTQENNDGTVGYLNPPKDTRWKPGQSGNPKGRPPKNLSITSLVKERLEQEGEQGKTNAELIAEAIIELAKKKDLPALIHTRGTWREAFEIAKETGIKKAVFHWYSGPVDVLEDILNEGYFVSASPSVAYSPESRRSMEIAPVEQTLIETDSPVYYKHCDGGLAAEPKDVFCTLKHYAMLKQRDAQELAEILNGNAEKVFGLKQD